MTNLGSYGGSLGCVKANVVELNIRNLIRLSEHREKSATWVSVDLEHYVRI